MGRGGLWGFDAEAGGCMVVKEPKETTGLPSQPELSEADMASLGRIMARNGADEPAEELDADAPAEPEPEAVATDESDDQESEETAETATPDPRVAKALRAIKLTGAVLSDEQIEALGAENIIEMGKAARATNRAQMEAWDQSQKTTEGTQEGAEAQAQPAAQPQTSLDDTLKPLDDLLGEEAAAPIRDVVKALEARNQALEQKLNQREADEFNKAGTEARTALADMYPAIADDEEFRDSVLPHAEALAKLPLYRGRPMKDLLQAACRAVYGDGATPSREPSPSSKSRSKGVADGTGRSSTVKRTIEKMTPKDIEAAMVAEMQKGGSDSPRYRSLKAELHSRS